MTIGR